MAGRTCFRRESLAGTGHPFGACPVVGGPAALRGWAAILAVGVGRAPVARRGAVIGIDATARRVCGAEAAGTVGVDAAIGGNAHVACDGEGLGATRRFAVAHAGAPAIGIDEARVVGRCARADARVDSRVRHVRRAGAGCGTVKGRGLGAASSPATSTVDPVRRLRGVTRACREDDRRRSQEREPHDGIVPSESGQDEPWSSGCGLTARVTRPARAGKRLATS